MMNSLECLERLYSMADCEHCSVWEKCNLNNNQICENYKNIIKQDLDSLETKCKVNQELNEVYKVKIKKLEKELKQTKLNFKNSQIHSKNRYKKLKEKYQKLEKEHEKLKEKYKHRAETSNDLCEAVKHYEKAFETINDYDKENERMRVETFNLKKVIELFKRKMIIVKLRDNEYIIRGNEYITKEQYEFLKEVFKNA